MRDVEVVNERRRLEAEAVARKEREEKEERARRRAARENPDEVEVDPVTGAPILRDPSRSSNANAASASENADTAADAEAFGTGPEARSPDYKELRLVVKADFSGTVEAVVGAISGIGNNEAGVKVVASGVGDPSEGDVALADAVGGECGVWALCCVCV